MYSAPVPAEESAGSESHLLRKTLLIKKAMDFAQFEMKTKEMESDRLRRAQRQRHREIQVQRQGEQGRVRFAHRVIQKEIDEEEEFERIWEELNQEEDGVKLQRQTSSSGRTRSSSTRSPVVSFDTETEKDYSSSAISSDSEIEAHVPELEYSSDVSSEDESPIDTMSESISMFSPPPAPRLKPTIIYDKFYTEPSRPPPPPPTPSTWYDSFDLPVIVAHPEPELTPSSSLTPMQTSESFGTMADVERDSLDMAPPSLEPESYPDAFDPSDDDSDSDSGPVTPPQESLMDSFETASHSMFSDADVNAPMYEVEHLEDHIGFDDFHFRDSTKGGRDHSEVQQQTLFAMPGRS